METEIEINCPSKLRTGHWPSSLVSIWRSAYPFIDDDDVRITEHQPTLHFYEWFAAIHLFHLYGAHSFIEKYQFKSHPEKQRLLPTVLGTETADSLISICGECRGQVPDLFTWIPGGTRRWFAEVKGPGDSISDGQLASHERIVRELNLSVQIIVVKIVE